MSSLVILVHTDSRTLRHTEALLSEQGLLVAALSSLPDAKRLLNSVMPDLLIAELRLDRYNGLQLAIRSSQDHPDVPVIITSRYPDAIAEAEAKQYGAAFVVAPLENRAFLPAVRNALDSRRRAQRPIRRWLRRPVSAAVELGVAHTRATILDVSYGGVRLAVRDAETLPTTFFITVPSENVKVAAHRVWTADSATDDQVYCGAELAEADTERWRRFVDSLHALNS
jgi:DNA-binding NtrC family response regulator